VLKPAAEVSALKDQLARLGALTVADPERQATELCEELASTRVRWQ
jgi:hypothetical protein